MRFARRRIWTKWRMGMFGLHWLKMKIGFGQAVRQIRRALFK